ncbi:uncharacterized protein LOC112171092 [Rosa chinensis]|uniref:uncharacterized protein LOC112171092 n=1 Tax=Rosa chinensis TaxID=74649 RepID=UPI000D09486D|nr:uncharacterized protein LOC112171092 [Rosa chinensis]
MGPQRRLGIYIGFDLPSIIRYLEPMTGETFTAQFVDCHFDETIFPSLGGDKTVPNERHELMWTVPTISHLDPRTKESEIEVRRILHLQNIANTMPDAFTDTAKVTRSHIPAINASARINVQIGQNNVAANEPSAARLKRGRPVGSKDSVPRKRKSKTHLNPNEIAPEENIGQDINVRSTIHDSVTTEEENDIGETLTHEEAQVPENKEFS